MMVYGHQSSASEGAYFMQNYQRRYQTDTESAPQMAPAPPPPLMHHHHHHNMQNQLAHPPPPPPLLPPMPPHHHQASSLPHLQHQPPPPQLLPPPPKLKYQGVCGGGPGDMSGGTAIISECCQEMDDFPVDDEGGDIGNATACCDFQHMAEMADCASSSSENGGSSSGFLYSLLTAQDAAAVQQCSAFLGGTADQFPRRSQSVSVPARRGSAVLPATCQGPLAAALGHSGHPFFMQGGVGASLAVGRPYSAPRGLRGPHGGGSAPALTTEEPLDLSAVNFRPMDPGAAAAAATAAAGCSGEASFIEQQIFLQQQQHQIKQLQHMHQQQQQQQPMLRNMLSAGTHYSMPPQLPPRQQHQQLQEQLQHQRQVPQYQRIHQPVQLAKKTVPVAQSHVADWLKKGTELVRTNSALFSALEPAHRASLLCRAWPRILQLYMLEHNFQFTVSPAQVASTSEAAAASAGRQPTLGFAEDLQRLIGSAAVLPFDTVTYNLLRLAAIFVADATHQPHLAEVHSEIMKHIYSHLRMKAMSQYFNDAVALLHAVAQTNKAMLESMFCTQFMSQTVDDFIRGQLA